MPCLDVGSKPEEGSSKNIILDFPIKAFANDTFLLLPPERFLTNFPFYVARLHSLMIS